MPVQITRVVSDMFDQNAYVVRAANSADAVVIDPGFCARDILSALQLEDLSVSAVLLTHGHVDHISGVGAVKKHFPDALIIIGTHDAAMLTDADLNLSGPFGVPVTSPPADRLVGEGDALTFAGLTFDVLDLPGHSPGHVVYVVRGEPVVFGGDVLFQSGIGRTDFPGGSHAQLIAGIRAKLWPMPDDTAVHPGHGPATTVGREKRTNPFV